ncbi:hypothetical protein FHS72_003749 [Loktanella ponticola]|uniref:Uncharacterized protein n=1 Tax=Yoonia ponticola TaxID=1524255 RepID=A0A7W9BP24_9RHOB|nr:hypothetical protein [Yoonia ponticola]
MSGADIQPGMLCRTWGDRHGGVEICRSLPSTSVSRMALEASFSVVEIKGFYLRRPAFRKGRRFADMIGHKHSYVQRDDQLAAMAAEQPRPGG